MGKMPQSNICDNCTLALLWLLQYLIVMGYVIYIVTYITGRELLPCIVLQAEFKNRTDE